MKNFDSNKISHIQAFANSQALTVGNIASGTLIDKVKGDAGEMLDSIQKGVTYFIAAAEIRDFSKDNSFGQVVLKLVLTDDDGSPVGMSVMTLPSLMRGENKNLNEVKKLIGKTNERKMSALIGGQLTVAEIGEIDKVFNDQPYKKKTYKLAELILGNEAALA